MKSLAFVCVVAISMSVALAKPKPEVQAERLTLIYLLQKDAPNNAIQGAMLGIEDDNTTGRFTHQVFDLTEHSFATDEDLAIQFKALIAKGYRHFIADLNSDQIKKIAQLPEARQSLIYNISSSDDRLRAEDCSANLLHIIPSRSMRTDALAQYFSKKRWQKLFLVTGQNPEDRLYGEALQRSAKKFGLKIVASKPWQHSFDERRSDEAEVPVFTQGIEYDVLVLADESGIFGDYFPYRTWLSRLVAGTQGLIATAWHPTLEHWGALQLQRRFRAKTQHWMSEKEYAAWLSVRSIGEASSQIHSIEFDKIKAFMRSDDFALAGFKGVPLSFRPWDGQLRQPLLLASDRSLIAAAPIEGFLHPKNELDTLGFDQAESKCHP